jgi:hypothetical protein
MHSLYDHGLLLLIAVCLPSNRNGGWAVPIFFGPCTLRRTLIA